MNRIVVALCAMSLAGCATYVTGRYSLSADNVVAMRSWPGIQLNVGSFSTAEGVTTQSCNYKGDIVTMDGESYATFIRNALVSEMKFAGVFSDKATTTITGKLEKIENSTAFATNWTLVLTLYSSNGKSITLVEDYNYNGSVFGTAASTCGALAGAFVPAVQNLLEKAVREIPKSLI